VRSLLDELEKELNELRALVASIAPVNSALKEHKDSVVRRYLTIRRRFDYAAFAVALYASFEKFLENLVAAYVRLETRRVRYNDLPPKLVRKHLFRTAEILSRGRLGEGRYAALSELDAVKNLFECLNGATPYNLNDMAVIAHDMNLRPSEIDGLFAAVGIEQVCERARRADAMLDWYMAAEGLTHTPQDGVPSATITRRIENIVERRNQVAHRGGTPVDLLGPEEMTDATEFIEAFAKSVFAMAVARYCQDHHVVPGKGILLQVREGPYQNGTIVVVDKPPERLFVGQPAFVAMESIGARWGRIRSLRVDEARVVAIEPGHVAPNGIGIGLDFRFPKGGALFALEADDDVVWSPSRTAATLER
jgi:hypothetical protein